MSWGNHTGSQVCTQVFCQAQLLLVQMCKLLTLVPAIGVWHTSRISRMCVDLRNHPVLFSLRLVCLFCMLTHKLNCILTNYCMVRHYRDTIRDKSPYRSCKVCLESIIRVNLSCHTAIFKRLQYAPF